MAVANFRGLVAVMVGDIKIVPFCKYELSVGRPKGIVRGNTTWSRRGEPAGIGTDQEGAAPRIQWLAATNSSDPSRETSVTMGIVERRRSDVARFRLPTAT